AANRTRPLGSLLAERSVRGVERARRDRHAGRLRTRLGRPRGHAAAPALRLRMVRGLLRFGAAVRGSEAPHGGTGRGIRAAEARGVGRRMSPQEWVGLALRWTHLIAGIAWIGSSFYFIWLDSHLERVLA